MLRDDGYAVESAADGFKALAKVADFAPDLILTDLKMPGMDGIAATQALRDRPELAESDVDLANRKISGKAARNARRRRDHAVRGPDSVLCRSSTQP